MAVSLLDDGAFKICPRGSDKTPLCQMSGACLYELKMRESRCQSQVGYSGCPYGIFPDEETELKSLSQRLEEI